jgi:hypothetical protein
MLPLTSDGDGVDIGVEVVEPGDMWKGGGVGDMDF